MAEAFSAHETNAFATSITRTVDPSTALQGGLTSSPPSSVPPVLAPTTPGLASSVFGVTTTTTVPDSELRALGGSALLAQLGSLSVGDIAHFVSTNPGVIHRFLLSPPTAVSNSSWWQSLGLSGQKKLAVTAPELVGNLDGVPYTVRDAANRRYLATAIAQAKSSLATRIGRATLLSERHHLVILQQIERTLHVSAREPQRQLITFDPTGNARAAVVVGDLQTADYVSYLVPGMFFTVQGQVYDWTTIAQDLHSQQTSWLKTLAASDPSYRGKTAATVAWIGYSTPGALDIASLGEADQGANLLGSAVQGVKAVRAGNEPYISVVAHSYGSTTAMIEFAKREVSVDALALIGSPGSAAQSASELAVKNDNVYVGEAAWDPVVNTAFYGSDPGLASFGAHPMDVAASTDPITGKKLAAAVGHLGYFDPGTTAMRNLALVSLGQGSLVSNGTVSDAGRVLGRN